MFGDNVKEPVTKAGANALREADALLVAGTSLQVFSAYKWILQAHEQNIPIAIVNIGPTRGDKQATLKIEARLGDILPLVVQPPTTTPPSEHNAILSSAAI